MACSEKPYHLTFNVKPVELARPTTVCVRSMDQIPPLKMAMCLSRQPLWYTALSSGCIPFFVVSRSTQPSTLCRTVNEYQLGQLKTRDMTWNCSGGGQRETCTVVLQLALHTFHWTVRVHKAPVRNASLARGREAYYLEADGAAASATADISSTYRDTLFKQLHSQKRGQGPCTQTLNKRNFLS